MAALTVQLHAEAIPRVEVQHLGDHTVSVAFGDDRSGVRLIGDVDDVAHLIAKAHRLLGVAQG